MKLLTGMAAYEHCRANNLFISPDHRVLYNKYLPYVPASYKTDAERALRFVEETYEQVRQVTWEPFDPASHSDHSLRAQQEEEARALVAEHGDEIFTILLETDNPEADEHTILAYIREMGDKPDGSSLVSARDIHEHIRQSGHPTPPPPHPLDEFEATSVCRFFDEAADHEPWIYETCLRLAKKGLLRTFDSDPYRPDEDFLDETTGRHLFVPAEVYDFIVEDAASTKQVS